MIPLILGGCATMEGLGSDLQHGWTTLSSSVAKAVDPIKEAKKKLPVYDGTCPQATARPDLTRLVEFYNPSRTDDASKLSEVTIVGLNNTCRVENDQLVMQIDLSLTGKIGPKAKVKSSDKVSFVYPYFVAVTDQTGVVVAKEIFAASMIYASNQTQGTQEETIFQNMPFPDTANGQTYNVIVGFQLSPEQLDYNHKQGMSPTSP